MRLIDYDVLSYIKDEMLSDPSVDAQFIYMCTGLAERDLELYHFLNEWMKSSDKEKDNIELFITERVNFLTSVEDLFV